MSNLDLLILKAIISNKKNALDFVNQHDAKLFGAEVWNFANIVVTYVKTHKDIPTLRVLEEKLAKGGNERLIESVKKTWGELDSIECNEHEFKHDLEKLKKRFAEKQIVDMKGVLDKFEAGSGDVGKTVSDLQKTVQNIKGLNQVKSYERKTLKEAVPVFREEYNAKMNDPSFDAGIKTGYSALDYATGGGIRFAELVLVGAETGAGKSMMLMNMAIQMWLQENTVDTDEKDFVPGNAVLYFSLEMPFKPCLNRVLARLSGVPSKKIESATLDAEEALKLKKSLKFISKYPYQFEIVDIPRSATIETIERIYEDAKELYNPQIIIIDYLGLMGCENSDEMDDHLKLAKISEQCHELVHNCIVLSATQLNRAESLKKIELVCTGQPAAAR